MEQEKIGFIGVGNMGGALAGAACAACGTSRVLVSDGTPERTRTIAEHLGAVCSDHATIATECRMIFLGVKPGLVQTVLAGILPVLEQRRDPVALVSMAAGVPISAVQSGMSEKKMPVIRIMPNTPVAVGEGMIVYTASPEVTKEDVLLLRQVLSCAGRLDAVTEAQVDMAGAVSGCGPAFVYLFLEAMADGAVECGLPREKALLYAEQTLLGAAKTALESGRHPGALKDAVCSPGGTTIAGVHALEAAGFRAAVMDAVTAAYRKTEEMQKH
ncbi:pyrroline-5-carboxylate reductase [Clostridium sp. CAG:448]|nr:pyrroline-5-carboxylate reductase [Clostridium sp. CAG:448]